MTSPEFSPIDHPTQPLPTSAQIAVGRIAEIEAQQLPAGQKYQEIRNAIEPPGPYKSMRHRRETAEHVAHHLLSNPPVSNTVEARQWVNGTYLSPTMHQLASHGDRLPKHEPYVSAKVGRRVVETIAHAVMNDTATDNPVNDLNRIGETLTAPAIEARNEKLPEGAKLMAVQVINAVKEIRQERIQEIPTPTRETVTKTNDRPRVATEKTSRASVRREAMLAGISHLRHRLDFRLLTQTSLNMSVQEIRSIGSNARQYVNDLVGRYGNKLPEWNKAQLIDAAKRTAAMSVQLAAQVPGVSDAARDRLKAMALRLESDEKNSTLAVGQELRDGLNSRTNEKLPEFSKNPERATVEASQLIVEWSDKQLQAPLTPEQEATRQAYKELVNSIAVGVNGEKFFNGKLPELVAERQFRSAADRSVDRTVDHLRKVLAPVIADHMEKGGEPARTAREFVERSGRAAGAERALIVSQMVNLSPEDAKKLEMARVSVVDKMAAVERVNPKTLTADERLLLSHPRLLEADLTQRGARLVALSNQWTRDGKWLNPENPADQHRAMARLVDNVAEGMTDADKQQSDLVRKKDELRKAAEKAAQQVIEAREAERRAAVEQALRSATPAHKSPGEDSQTLGRTQVLRPEGLTR